MPITTYKELAVRIEPRRDAVYPFSLGGLIDGRGEFAPPTASPQFRALAARLAALDTDERALEAIGTTLFDLLFQGSARNAYSAAFGNVRAAPDTGLRIRFEIPAAEAEVAELPWEYLWDPDSGPLAMLDAPVVRYLPQPTVIPELAATLPLKVLLTGAQTPPATDVAAELAEARAALADLEGRGLVAVTAEERLTAQTLQRRLREGFHVWHFVGHGGLARDGRTGALFFEDASGDPEAVNALQLNILLNRSGVRLVVLSACNSGSLNALAPFRSVAPALIRAQIPAVVAMQFSVPEDATRAFAGEFYRALAGGLPIDGCMTEGRKAVMGATGLGRPDWGIPVLYTRAASGRLFDLPAQPPGGVAAAGPQQVNTVHISGTGPGSTTNVTVGTVLTGGAPAGEQTAEAEALAQQIQLLKRRLWLLEEQKAKAGAFADPSIIMEIEDLQQEIAAKERALAELRR